MSAPVLAFPRFDLEFVVDCDASDYGLGAVITPVGCWTIMSGGTAPLRERCWPWCTLSSTSTMRTDHNVLKWLQSFKEPEGQVARWLELLAQYDYKIEHHPGKKHQNAEALSRNPLPVATAAGQTVQTNAVDSGDRTWFRGWTAADLQLRQATDPDLKLIPILSWKQNQTSQPAPQEVQGVSKATSRACGRSGTGCSHRMVYSTDTGRLTMAVVPGYSSCCPDPWYQQSCLPSMTHLLLVTLVSPGHLSEYESGSIGMASSMT